ncbi:thymidylate synthase ThyX [Calothrix sp. NIES-2100]|uniref:FAD-dependent thymidylate synthase n=1 Tax=Calothrix sp. NIES-2100 TaxID=1954172 RepID=UPI000B60CBF1|nr:thymidylate synthase ThyX [Calothrix sp. NIES-2100]
MNNIVELLGFYGGDKRVCLSAWQSTTEELGIDLPDDISDRVDVIFEYLCTQKKKTPFELLNFLAENHHETPFEKAILDFQLTGDIASHIHVIKHRISSVNAESQRYKEFIYDRFYIPDDWQGIQATGDVTWFTNFEEECVFSNKNEYWQDILENYSQLGFNLYHQAIEDLTPVLGKKTC